MNWPRLRPSHTQLEIDAARFLKEEGFTGIEFEYPISGREGRTRVDVYASSPIKAVVECGNTPSNRIMLLSQSDVEIIYRWPWKSPKPRIVRLCSQCPFEPPNYPWCSELRRHSRVQPTGCPARPINHLLRLHREAAREALGQC